MRRFTNKERLDYMNILLICPTWTDDLGVFAKIAKINSAKINSARINAAKNNYFRVFHIVQLCIFNSLDMFQDQYCTLTFIINGPPRLLIFEKNPHPPGP